MKPILLVEDEAIMRESVKDWLTDIGYQVETVEDGEQASKTISEQDFGLVILDLRLPGKDGLEVLREATARQPQLKGVIITAYPSIETAVEAIKCGAVDYLPKPLDLNRLEELIHDVLGPVQIELGPRAVSKEVVAEPSVVEGNKVEEAITINPKEIPFYQKQGKAYFKAGRYQEALKQFRAILKVAPGNINARLWIRKTEQALETPSGEGAGEEERPKNCVWMSLGMVAERICTNDYNCMNCEFDEEMRKNMASGQSPELDAALERLKQLPGSQRLCRYALKGDVSYRLCSRLFQCDTCEFGQMMDDTLQRLLVQREIELAAREEALQKKQESWWWSYWS